MRSSPRLSLRSHNAVELIMDSFRTNDQNPSSRTRDVTFSKPMLPIMQPALSRYMFPGSHFTYLLSFSSYYYTLLFLIIVVTTFSKARLCMGGSFTDGFLSVYQLYMLFADWCVSLTFCNTLSFKLFLIMLLS